MSTTTTFVCGIRGCDAPATEIQPALFGRTTYRCHPHHAQDLANQAAADNYDPAAAYE
ncbi:hypothetical protein ACIBQ0_24220 [Nocardia nova]|uniref:hypothetical protein n=1 Tax=Nocardia nova TaxID=37330 RepID=UPI003790A48F